MTPGPSDQFGPEALEAASAFADALDREEYDKARTLLDSACAYTIRGKTLRGPEAILASYQGNGDAARRFDEIRYASVVRVAPTDEPSGPGWVVITFSDHIRHGDRRHAYVCEQWVRVGPAGTIVEIEHRELPGERERLEAFRRDAGV